MAKVTRRELAPNDPIFTSGPQVFVPIARPRAGGMPKSGGPIERGTVEESLQRQIENGELPK